MSEQTRQAIERGGLVEPGKIDSGMEALTAKIDLIEKQTLSGRTRRIAEANDLQRAAA